MPVLPGRHGSATPGRTFRDIPDPGAPPRTDVGLDLLASAPRGAERRPGPVTSASLPQRPGNPGRKGNP